MNLGNIKNFIIYVIIFLGEQGEILGQKKYLNKCG